MKVGKKKKEKEEERKKLRKNAKRVNKSLASEQKFYKSNKAKSISQG
jgi:hypothetical protein